MSHASTVQTEAKPTEAKSEVRCSADIRSDRVRVARNSSSPSSVRTLQVQPSPHNSLFTHVTTHKTPTSEYANLSSIGTTLYGHSACTQWSSMVVPVENCVERLYPAKCTQPWRQGFIVCNTTRLSSSSSLSAAQARPMPGLVGAIAPPCKRTTSRSAKRAAAAGPSMIPVGPKPHASHSPPKPRAAHSPTMGSPSLENGIKPTQAPDSAAGSLSNPLITWWTAPVP
mmetsp:Transcript_30203/g.68192  ORF Transcript_30203/g.68192 Transcript_30203/m.68192 type:complete len:227 (-) Transcript_30203:444-1124(-)|eukprot:CAMPEP_0181215502 /NCGR_PEP_ID=MMETSP1096-20121128/26050_1 /TAXON_ID=156174 ORGANISM="Chrysochromulina ericina, Strain CCMP281" /NCGR_SAMPLE_ID=MMETSP1096 /ASSEMBLY_ACC=CAM_ASM_000453 /LENGTH=226 /DNA_ID=CAMNT_0023307367 /DNA_START=64 /DNA_END=747 /DNA_ORIENTATION=-